MLGPAPIPDFDRRAGETGGSSSHPQRDRSGFTVVREVRQIPEGDPERPPRGGDGACVRACAVPGERRASREYRTDRGRTEREQEYEDATPPRDVLVAENEEGRVDGERSQWWREQKRYPGPSR